MGDATDNFLLTQRERFNLKALRRLSTTHLFLEPESAAKETPKEQRQTEARRAKEEHYRKRLQAVTKEVLGDHVNEGLIDTIRLTLPVRIHPKDQRIFETNTETWKAGGRYENITASGKVHECLRYTHRESGAIVMVGTRTTRVQFSPIRVLGRRNNIRIDLVSHRNLLKAIKMMTVDLLPKTTAKSYTKWRIIWIALARNLILGTQRDAVLNFIHKTKWTTHETNFYDSRFGKIEKKDNGKDPEEIPAYIKVVWGSSKRGNKSRLQLYSKFLERAAKGTTEETEEASGLFRLECSHYGSDKVAILGRALNPGSDIFITAKSKPYGLTLDYPALHALYLAEILALRPGHTKTADKKRKKPSDPFPFKDHCNAAIETLIKSAYPRARWS